MKTTAALTLLASVCASAASALDLTPPTVTAFAVPRLTNTLTVPVSSLAASDAVGVGGYLITENATPPAAANPSWSSVKPSVYTVSAPGAKTLYAWARDTAGNISRPRSAPVTVDTSAPSVTAFTAPTVSKTLTVSITRLTASDNTAVAGYRLTESGTAPAAGAAGWNPKAPTSYLFAGSGVKTLYAWAKDTAGNVSAASTASVTVDTTAPTISAFAAAPLINTLAVPLTSFTAADNLGVAGYLVTLTSTAPSAAATSWATVKPSSFQAPSSGVKTLYAWVKDTAGNVSAPAKATVTIDTVAPVVKDFRIPSSSETLAIPVEALAATDNTGVTGYLITETASAPSPAATGWQTSAPATYTVASTGEKTLYAWALDGAANVSLAKLATCTVTPAQPEGPAFNLAQTLSDGAQRTTLAFSGLALITGNLEAQSFFPPGKVADYTGFQFLRDNDPDGMGHNTSFLTRVANNVLYVLNDAQFAQLKTLAVAQQDAINLYGYKRFSLMKAFRRLLDGDRPAGASGLNLNAVKKASGELYRIDGQLSFDRALLYAALINSLSADQTAYLDGMKGKGWSSWPDITNDQLRAKMQGLPQGTAVAVMTYAGDLFSWYAGSVEADVYFCPERQGTYYGGFYIKDAPAIGHEGYGINEQLTATAGAALSDSAKGYVTADQAALMSSLVDTQRNNLYASPTASIVQVRTEIAALLRSLLDSPADTAAVETQVLDWSELYGELDGENNHAYATVFAQVYASLTDDQLTKLSDLRKSILSGTYADGTPFDFTLCTTPFLYSSVITDLTLLAPYVADTDFLFFEP